MQIAIYGNRRQQAHILSILALLDELDANGVEILMHSKLYNYLHDNACRDFKVARVVADDDPFDASMALSIGADGTFLNTARCIGTRQIPILGINTGHLGYLAACTMDDAIGYVPAIVKGLYVVEDRSMLWVKSLTHRIDWPYALNEVAILKKDTSSMLNVQTTINGQPLAVYRADGLIISTPTGSTGYNLSVGGPILQPSTPALVIVPIAPHSLTMRPVVIDDRSTITTTTDTRADSYLLSLDGRSTPLPVDSTLTIHRAPFVTKVVHLTRDYTFVDTLHSKLHWGS